MSLRILVTLIGFALCVPCFAESDSSEEMPSVPELIKKMYDYRMAIKNMQAKVTVTHPIDTKQPVAEKIKEKYFLAYSEGKFRLDKIMFNIHQEQRLYQYLSTPQFYFNRHHSPNANNDGNSLLFGRPLSKPIETFDPRRIGTDTAFFSHMEIYPFNHDRLLQHFYSPVGKNFTVEYDIIDDQKLLKISCQIDDSGNKGEFSFWIDPKRGYSLIQSRFYSEMFDHLSTYNVTLEKYGSAKGGTWFPKQMYYKYRLKDMRIEEHTVLDSVVFDVPDEKPFTLAGLDIPIGYKVKYKNEGMRTWNGKELVENIPYPIEPAKWSNRETFFVVNAIGFLIVGIIILIRLFLYGKS